MDLWNLSLNRALQVPLPNYCLVGRWLCHMTDGTFVHQSIAAAAPKPAECAIGWIAHYTLGVLFAAGLVAMEPQWLRSPTLMPALNFGIATVVIPFFIMQPAFGQGVAASKTPNPTQAPLRSLINHAVFGAGLYVAALAIRPVLAAQT